MKINIGSGNKPIEGYEGVDIKDYGQEYVFDIEEEWEIESNSVDEIYSSHCLEHVQHINFVMSEMYRICKPDTVLRIKVPYFKSEGAFRDPGHVRFFTEYTFYYFNKAFAKQVSYDMEYDFDFEVVSKFITDNGNNMEVELRPIK